MARGEAIVAAARGCVGARFRAQGRDVQGGLDCVGLVEIALRGAGVGAAAPCDYALRGELGGRIAAGLAAAGLRAIEDVEPRAGDVVLLAAGPGQLHLGIATGAGLIHADAGLRRVAERPGAPPWPLAGVWRLDEEGA